MPFLCLLKKGHWGNIALKLKFDVENVNVKTEFLKKIFIDWKLSLSTLHLSIIQYPWPRFTMHNSRRYYYYLSLYSPKYLRGAFPGNDFMLIMKICH